MANTEIKEIISALREYTISERLKNSSREIDIFFINAIEIACNHTEFGLSQSRPITKEEEYWFEGSYHMNFWDAEIEEKFYGPLVHEVRERNWFR